MAIISDENPVRTEYHVAADVVSLVVSSLALPVVALLVWGRWPKGGREGLTVATALCLLCYVTTFLYIVAVTLMMHVQWERTEELCNAMMIVCMLLHNSSKASEFAFLIERAYVISWKRKPRRKTPEYVLSSLLIILPYIATTIVAIRFRIAYMVNAQICIIGLEYFAIGSMLSVELLAQLVLTLRFLVPLITVHRKGNGLMLPLRNAVVRTVVGCAITMLLNVAVKISLLLFDGMPAWLCYLGCKVEALLAACVLHWITKPVLADEEREAQRRFGDECDDDSSDSSKEMDLQEMLGLPAGGHATDRSKE
ncbi:hypothetical protein CLAFUW4_08616 [Fulvia fulva]|uniref:Uncharacterized protein n=1 Tax=Passalora fulva TaxID=5499 RepID=A0A9Q8LDY9_PASFU|nr:uncharacterized protein CLAFUR5_08717 [Fulvia fulva]KAK4629192.1 hypothetical protein CLAFUR4_08619 [Fulvia fulva]KAK4630457.1 hypothetical protein CLAFUR0_08614 [Fulvia fulva]UJO15656.1 hypothetical protein CLAFUR5_08717 [Fulvia fulva]WPV12473.1 hypothetical protein CLAFUW4_08616 [Fulvia fulva]WPV27588.1 hypothetical protein CLAFUW7_08614 [Fulvia fulva]